MLHKETWVTKLLGTHVHKKVKFSRRGYLLVIGSPNGSIAKLTQRILDDNTEEVQLIKN